MITDTTKPRISRTNKSGTKMKKSSKKQEVNQIIEFDLKIENMPTAFHHCAAIGFCLFCEKMKESGIDGPNVEFIGPNHIHITATKENLINLYQLYYKTKTITKKDKEEFLAPDISWYFNASSYPEVFINLYNRAFSEAIIHGGITKIFKNKNTPEKKAIETIKNISKQKSCTIDGSVIPGTYVKTYDGREIIDSPENATILPFWIFAVGVYDLQNMEEKDGKITFSHKGYTFCLPNVSNLRMFYKKWKEYIKDYISDDEPLNIKYPIPKKSVICIPKEGLYEFIDSTAKIVHTKEFNNKIAFLGTFINFVEYYSICQINKTKTRKKTITTSRETGGLSSFNVDEFEKTNLFLKDGVLPLDNSSNFLYHTLV